MFRKGLILLLLTVSAVSARVVVRLAPPVPVVETVVPAPAPGYVWTPGYYTWNGRAYVWAPGAWVVAPWQGARWEPPHWVRRGFGGGWFWRGFGDGMAVTDVENIPIGTLVVDIFDSPTKKLIWRGVAKRCAV